MKPEEIIEFQACIDNFINYLNKQNYSKCSIERFSYHLSLFKEFCLQNRRCDYLSEQVFSDYISSILDYPECKIKFASRVLNKFIEYSLTGSIHYSYKTSKDTVQNTEFSEILMDFKDQLSHSEIKISSQNKQIRTIKLFLNYLENKGINSLSEISIQNVYQFINNPKFATATKSGYSQDLKKFFKFLYANQKFHISESEIFPKIIHNTRSKILSFCNKQELQKIINAIDTDSALGKRDYCIITLAMLLGLRASDISNLMQENIDWNKKIIKINQQKTGKELIQPIPDEVFFALIDYIKNGRPSTSSRYLFVTNCAPFLKISSSNLSSITEKYFIRANIDTKSRKHGIHCLRHSFATNMLENNIPLPDISASLGHTYISTTTLYTNVDINKLKKISLEVDIDE